MSDVLGGGGDFGELLAHMQRLQDNLEQAKGESAATDFEGTAGGGAVTIKVNGEHVYSSVHIDPSVVDRDGVDLLEDLILAALHDATQKVNAAQQASVGNAMTSALSGLFGSGEMPDLPFQIGDDGATDTTNR